MVSGSYRAEVEGGGLRLAFGDPVEAENGSRLSLYYRIGDESLDRCGGMLATTLLLRLPLLLWLLEDDD